MIIKMRKYSFLIYHKIYLDFLDKIRDIGVLHVIEKAEGTSEDEGLMEKMKFSSELNSVLTALKKNLPENAILLPAAQEMDGELLLNQVKDKFKQLESLSQKLVTAHRDLERISVWGAFSIQRIQSLEDAGFEMRFYNCNLRKYHPEWESLYNAFVISTIGPLVYFVTINQPGTVIDIDADPMSVPEANTDDMATQIANLQSEIETLNKDIEKLAIEKYHTLDAYHNVIQGEIDFSKIVLNTQSEVENKVMILEGFCPDESETALQEYLNNSGIFYEASDPDIMEDIPIKLKNNAFSKLFEPITELFSLPNYSELDPTPFLAPFFMLFFGLCLGDGGYGLIIWAVATFMKRKSKPSMKGLLGLAQYLGLATVFVGILTGSFFGIALDQVEWTWLKGVKQLFLTEDNYGAFFSGYNPMMILALAVGIIQILFGMILNALKVQKQHGFKHALGHFAWVVFIVSAGTYLAISKMTYSPVLIYVLYGFISLSVLIIVFYNSPGKNIFVNMGSALWHTYNMATGLLGDSLSYIRLFALGLTGSILGGVFNMLAFDLTSSIPFAPGRWIAILLILLAGHTINFALCMIGAFVHPLRLVFVEFYKNAGFEGGGKAYKPFRKVQ